MPRPDGGEVSCTSLPLSHARFILIYFHASALIYFHALGLRVHTFDDRMGEDGTSAADRAPGSEGAKPLLVSKAEAPPRLLAQTLLSALRLQRDGKGARAVQMLSDVPRYVACVQDGQLAVGVIHHRVRQYMEEACLQDLAALEKSSIPDLHKTAKRNKIRRTLAAHRLERRRLILDGLYDDEGRLVESAGEAGQLLQRQWAPVFAGSQRASEARDVFLAHVMKVSGGDNVCMAAGSHRRRRSNVAGLFPWS